MSELQEMTKIIFDEESKSQEISERKYFDSKSKRFLKRFFFCLLLLAILISVIGIFYRYEYKISNLNKKFENRFETHKGETLKKSKIIWLLLNYATLCHLMPPYATLCHLIPSYATYVGK